MFMRYLKKSLDLAVQQVEQDPLSGKLILIILSFISYTKPQQVLYYLWER